MLLGGMLKMLVEENLFHSGRVQVSNLTSGIPSSSKTAVYFSQLSSMPNRGTRLETSTGNGFGPLQMVLVSVFLISLFLVGCSPGIQQTDFGPAEGPPVVVISGGSTISGDLVHDATVDHRSGGGSSGVGASSATSGLSTSEIQNSVGDRKAELLRFGREPAVQERVRRVLGWLEFVRSRVTLPRLQMGLTRFIAGDVSGSSMTGETVANEYNLWLELFVHPEFDATLSAEDLSAIRSRTSKLAQILVTAEKPEDVQDLDRILTENVVVADP